MSRRRVDWGEQLQAYAGALWMLGLMVVGLVALRSAVGPDGLGIWWRQVLWFGLGLIGAFTVSRIDHRWSLRQSMPLLVAVGLLLLAVLVVGQIGGGSRRWVGFGPARIQPSELAKIAVILWLAYWLAQRPRPGGARLIHLLVPGVVVGLLVGLILVQPDLGTAVAVLAGGAGVVLVSGVARRVLVGLGLAGLASGVLAWFFVLRPYQKRRIIGFLNPESDPLGIGYHTIQSKIAIGAGGLGGAGYGRSTQAGLHFLPEKHTDFIFAVWAEEWGFFGSLVVLGLFAGLLRWIARTALEARDPAGRLLVAGILVHFVFHVGLNLAMAVGWAPVVGIPLPWMSYGGSAALVNCLAIGLVLAVRQRRHMFAQL